MLLNDSAKISFKFTDKVPFLADLSVIKTHFTDKPAFSSDLSGYARIMV
ncbi:MAG: prevent-host-death protein [Ligilactobacillus ruminis]|nr:prevent-host-death protein [Ligilactobacillus ruminis]